MILFWASPWHSGKCRSSRSRGSGFSILEELTVPHSPHIVLGLNEATRSIMGGGLAHSVQSTGLYCGDTHNICKLNPSKSIR